MLRSETFYIQSADASMSREKAVDLSAMQGEITDSQTRRFIELFQNACIGDIRDPLYHDQTTGKETTVSKEAITFTSSSQSKSSLGALFDRKS